MQMPTNWKSTTSAIVAAFFGFVLFKPVYFLHYPWLIDLAAYAAAGGLVSLGFFSKDKDVTGGTVAQGDKATGIPAAGSVEPIPAVVQVTPPPQAKP